MLDDELLTLTELEELTNELLLAIKLLLLDDKLLLSMALLDTRLSELEGSTEWLLFEEAVLEDVIEADETEELLISTTDDDELLFPP